MNVFLWVLAGLLAALFLAAGTPKLLQSKEKVIEATGTWAVNYPPAAIKAIGLLEILGGIGLVLPSAVDIAPGLVPVAATGLAIIMAGAAVVHGRRGEGRSVVVNLLLLVLAAVVAWGRFGPYAF
ncbi:DoxX family protein [Kitasatospora sp. NPDC057692]|uniref:DoxX family protein n=1 Tax=Kitasatospora sp. NPDC057692 TaxID=3346215 RepID=UPI0036BD2C9C